jgi:polysaccharide biosynthesis transport protein
MDHNGAEPSGGQRRESDQIGEASMKFLRRYIVWIFLATLACTVGAWEIAAGQGAAYAATATVDVEATINPGTTPVTPDAGTEVAVATSGVVVSAMQPSFGMSSATLATHLTVANPANTSILNITCTMPAPSIAQACANAAAVAYTNYRNDVTNSAKVRALDPLHVFFVTHASLPTGQSHKRKVELIAVGIILGAGLGIGTALLRDRTDDRIRDRLDFETCLNGPVLGDIPMPDRRAGAPEAAVVNDPRSSQAEAFRHLRARITPLLDTTEARGSVVLVTSAKAGENSTSIACNLAAVMAYGGLKVLLVDADLRRRSLSKAFEIREQPGFTDLLDDRVKHDDAIMRTDVVPGLRFMTTGSTIDRPADLLDKSRLWRAFHRLTVVADVVIVNSAPIKNAADALALASVSDIVLLTGTVRRSERAPVAAAAEEIREVGTAKVAGVLNRPAALWRRLLPRPESTGEWDSEPDTTDDEPALNFDDFEEDAADSEPVTETVRQVQAGPGSEPSV